MKLLNSQGIDPLLFQAIKRAMGDHPGREETGYYVSVTQLLNEPQQVILDWRHEEEVEKDAMDCIDLFMGTAIHQYIHDTAVQKGYKGLSEQRWSTKILGKVVSGGMDNGALIRAKTLFIKDYKLVKSYAAGLDSKRDDWTAQLNMYGYMARENGYEVEKVGIVSMIKDFAQGTRGKSIKDYKTGEILGKHPSTQVFEIPLEVWSQEKTRGFMEERVGRLIEAEKMGDAKLPRCKDTWRNNIRCSKYCQVRKFCHQANSR